MKNLDKYLLCIVPILYLFLGCDIDRNNPGYEYFDDMSRSAAYETYTENLNFEDGKTNQWIPDGSIPTTGMIRRFEKTDIDRLKASELLESSIEISVENKAKGKQLYRIYCENCHGVSGDGNGYLYSSKKYPYPPASLINAKMKNESEGSIFHAISIGYGVMGAHGGQLQPVDRWRVVMYIQSELQSKILM